MPFICVIDTICQRRIASWRDEDGRPIVYDTEQDAELDAGDPDMLAMGNDPDMIEEVTVTEDQIIGVVDGRIYWTKGEKQ